MYPKFINYFTKPCDTKLSTIKKILRSKEIDTAQKFEVILNTNLASLIGALAIIDKTNFETLKKLTINWIKSIKKLKTLEIVIEKFKEWNRSPRLQSIITFAENLKITRIREEDTLRYSWYLFALVWKPNETRFPLLVLFNIMTYCYCLILGYSAVWVGAWNLICLKLCIVGFWLMTEINLMAFSLKQNQLLKNSGWAGVKSLLKIRAKYLGKKFWTIKKSAIKMINFN